MKVRNALCFVVAATIGSAPALAVEPLWSGDFETGSLSQWSKLDVAPGSALKVVSEPVQQGHYAMRATVVPGGLSNNGNRAEVVLTNPIFREGDERWFHWYTLFPANFVTSPKWHVYTQWHSNGFGVPLGFSLHGETLSFRVMGHAYDAEGLWDAGTLWKDRLQRGKWNEYLFHVKFSDRSSVGFVELWVDGKLVIPKTMHRTLDPGDSVYLKFGLYRDRTIGWDQSIYHDGMRVYAADPRTRADRGSPGVDGPVAGGADLGDPHGSDLDGPDAGAADLGQPNASVGDAPAGAVAPGEGGCGSAPVASAGLFFPFTFALLSIGRGGRRRRLRLTSRTARFRAPFRDEGSD